MIRKQPEAERAVTLPVPATPRGLPAGGLALAYVTLALSPLLGAALSGVDPAGPWVELGSGLGLVAAALLLLQFLSSGRFECIAGRIGLDRTMGVHRLAALVVLGLVVLHPLAYVMSTTLIDPASGLDRLMSLLGSPGLRSGVLALVALVLLMALAALRPRLKYEIWRASHGLLALAAVVAASHHVWTRGIYSQEVPLRYIWLGLAGAALVSVSLVYAVRPWRMWRAGWQVEYARRVADRIVELGLVSTGQAPMAFRGGQFIWLALAPNQPPVHDHPFSIASGPAEWPRLRLIVRESGNCTDHFAATQPGTRVAVDGPHGSFVLPSGTGPVLIVAGGVGIAPILSILEEAATRGDPRAFRVIYAARHVNALAGLERLRELARTLRLEILALAEAGEDVGVEPGRLNADRIKAAATGWEPELLVALVCGPGPMLDLTTDTLLEIGVRAEAIRYERFDFAAGRSRLDRRRRWSALTVFAAVLAGVVAFALR